MASEGQGLPFISLHLPHRLKKDPPRFQGEVVNMQTAGDLPSLVCPLQIAALFRLRSTVLQTSPARPNYPGLHLTSYLGTLMQFGRGAASPLPDRTALYFGEAAKKSEPGGGK
ncbi:unnamed protein product [Pleuronectes platessa]|uniref:Uncharacterized protein n=1 Tax=Pleuronectes platessa TaxID=8262 RepID=A0A9N7V6P7_PLEPL|nr:unnamed protein product [Pleuronectes platessa]